MPFAINRSLLTPAQREVYLSPYERHLWKWDSPGIAFKWCGKCGAAAAIAPERCSVVLAGPPRAGFGCLEYPGGVTVRADLAALHR